MPTTGQQQRRRSRAAQPDDDLEAQVRARLAELERDAALVPHPAIGNALHAVLTLHGPNEWGNCGNRCYTTGMAPAKHPCQTWRVAADILGIPAGTEASR